MENIKKSWSPPLPPSPCTCLCSQSKHPALSGVAAIGVLAEFHQRRRERR
ncbi:hypothetical protein COLO4_26722 [Corchorus olitorius]|uniref:Uncharacterized protein n=1 Tax=Corchorus olitorius TaxID=93759 RepID=A0A1R3HV45_9ROSI|nr:hypothetical protein COLO4_26722 [Corchorus olitorius]